MHGRKIKVLVVACLSLALWACGGGEEESPPGEPDAAAAGGAGGETSPDARAPVSPVILKAGPETITVWNHLNNEKSEHKRTEFDYDSMGRVVEIRQFDLAEGAASTSLSNTRTFDYNASGQIREEHWRSARSDTTFDYVYSYTNGRRTKSVETQVLGGQTEVTTETYLYDSNGRLVSQQSVGVITIDQEFTYDDAGRVTHDHFAGATAWTDDVWEYDERGQLARHSVTYKDEDAGQDGYFYNAAGWLEKLERATTVEPTQRTYFRNSAGLLLRIEIRTKSKQLALTEEYTMSAEGSAHYWLDAGHTYPMAVEAMEIYGVSPNRYEGTPSGGTVEPMGGAGGMMVGGMGGTGGVQGMGGAGGVQGMGGSGGVAGSGGSVGNSATLLTKLVVPAASYDTRLDQISGSQLSTTIASYGNAGYVITAATTSSAGYTLWGFKPKGSNAVYDTRLDQITGNQLSSTIASYGNAGFVITAATSNSAGYTLWGFKPKGISTPYETRLDQITGSQLSSTIASYGAAGYVITAAATNSAGYTLWGFKPQGSTATYATRLSQITGSELSSNITSYANEGYVITAAATNSSGYTLWGFKQNGISPTYSGRVTQIVGGQLSSTIEGFGIIGHLITAAVSNNSGYTIWGFKKN